MKMRNMALRPSLLTWATLTILFALVVPAHGRTININL